MEPRAIEQDYGPDIHIRFWEKVDIPAPTLCWSWLAGLSTGRTPGYGRFQIRAGKEEKAHRFAYRALRGPVPPGLVLDHLCRNRKCVNPDHLEPVTQRENILRGTGVGARNSQKICCPQGHPYTHIGGNGARLCRTCQRVSTRKRNAKRRVEGGLIHGRV